MFVFPKSFFFEVAAFAHQVLGFKTQGHFDGFSETFTPTRVTRFRKGISLDLIQSLVITLTQDVGNVRSYAHR